MSPMCHISHNNWKDFIVQLHNRRGTVMTSCLDHVKSLLFFGQWSCDADGSVSNFQFITRVTAVVRSVMQSKSLYVVIYPQGCGSDTCLCFMYKLVSFLCKCNWYSINSRIGIYIDSMVPLLVSVLNLTNLRSDTVAFFYWFDNSYCESRPIR